MVYAKFFLLSEILRNCYARKNVIDMSSLTHTQHTKHTHTHTPHTHTHTHTHTYTQYTYTHTHTHKEKHRDRTQDCFNDSSTIDFHDHATPGSVTQRTLAAPRRGGQQTICKLKNLKLNTLFQHLKIEIFTLESILQHF